MFLHIIFIIVLYMIYYILNYNVEYMSNLNTKTVNTQSSFLLDPLFADVKTYLNDDAEDSIQKLGIEKCIIDPLCAVCVENGITGNAFCYPK